MIGYIEKKDGDRVVFYDEKNSLELAYYYDDENKIRHIIVNEENCLKISSEVIFKLFNNIYFLAAKEGFFPKCTSTLIQNYIVSDNSMLVKDIKPINFDGEIDISDVNSLSMCIELPVRDACSKLNQKGIKTLMSSANQQDVEKRYEKIKSYSNFANEHYNIGNGYAWIMIDWETLTLENKRILINLKLGNISIPLTEKEKNNLIHNCKLNNINPSQSELIAFFEVVDERVLHENRDIIGQLSKDSEEDICFDKYRRGYACINSLCNHGFDFRVVVLRYPIDEETTISDVIKYFSMIVNQLVDQRSENRLEINMYM